MFKDGTALNTFDYVVANPPFSDKRWNTRHRPVARPLRALQAFRRAPGETGRLRLPPAHRQVTKKQRQRGRILPHGVLFRGNAEADIRRELVRKGISRASSDCPPNLFFGTGISACIIVIDKEYGHARKGIFMIDASKGFMKDGPKNRLRAQDIHRIVYVVNKQTEVPKYSRMVSVEEIERNGSTLNIPRYIDSQEPENLEDIEGPREGRHPRVGHQCSRKLLDGVPLTPAEPVRAASSRLREAGPHERSDQAVNLRASGIHHVHKRA